VRPPTTVELDHLAPRERVKELPRPLIPADAGIQTLPNCKDVQWAKAGSRPRGRAGGETSVLISFLHRLSRGEHRGSFVAPGDGDHGHRFHTSTRFKVDGFPSLGAFECAGQRRRPGDQAGRWLSLVLPHYVNLG
jgi:hypothetical protein